MEISYVVMAATLGLLLLVAVRLRRPRGLVLHSGLPTQPATPPDITLDTQLKHLTSRISLLAAEGYGYNGAATHAPNSTIDPAPFGHQADTWLDFVCAVEPQDDVWMVKIPQGEIITRLGVPLSDDAHGFAIVRQGRVIHEFFYHRH
ncbi:hypothetical protein MCEMSE6_02692 [Oxalobacteraceae bacterium]